MAWQDDLNSLDEELSAGRIRAEEYRRRRDELLAAASSNPVGLRRIHRLQPPSIANAFNGDAKPTDADTTQQVEVPASAWKASPPIAAEPPRPPVVPSTQAQVPYQGDEVFGLAIASTPPVRRRWPRFVAAIVVLAVAAGAVWWFALRDDAAPTSEQAVQETGQLSLASLPNPTEVPVSYSGTLTVDQLQIYNMAGPEEAGLLAAAGTDQVFYRGVTASKLIYHTYAYRTKDQAAARGLITKIIDRNKRIGMSDLTVAGVPGTLTTQQVSNEATGIYEAVYVSDRAVVRIVVTMAQPVTDDTLEGGMKRSVDAVTRSIPPS